jgi:glycerophosphoryl diester phosphodiesterase
MKKIKIIAHRGASKFAPENTLPSFRKAVEQRADSIELDIHETADGKIVVHHDYLLGHPDNGLGVMYKTSYAKLKDIDAGSWFSKDFAGESIPLLKEVLKEIGIKCEYEIELKGTTKRFIKNVLKIVDTFGLLNKIEFTSPHIAVLCALKKLSSRARCGVFFSTYPSWMSSDLGEKIILDTLKLVPAHVAHLPLSIITSSFVKDLHKNKIFVHAADCNDNEMIMKAIKLDCDQISTNDVELAYRLINKIK